MKSQFLKAYKLRVCLHMPFNNGDQEASFLKQPKVAKAGQPWGTRTLKQRRVNRCNSRQKREDIER